MNDATVVDSDLDAAVAIPVVTVEGDATRARFIDEDTHIENLDLAEALIGAHTQISNGG